MSNKVEYTTITAKEFVQGFSREDFRKRIEKEQRERNGVDKKND